MFCDIWEPSDNWAGISDQARRKKLQNKLNQRAYRRRHGKKGDQASSSSGESDNRGVICTIVRDTTIRQHEAEAGAASLIGAVRNDESILITLLAGCELIECPRRQALARTRIQQVYEDYSLHAPRPKALHTLIRLRVLAALAHNASCMGFPAEGLCRSDYISPYNTYGPLIPFQSRIASPALQPTLLQRTVLHHPWIDLFPFPRLRDNVLVGVVKGDLDDDELCADILEVKDEDLGDKPSLIVWGEPWDSKAWEANENFFTKWGFLVKGCPELLEATNCWRVKRGEEKFVFEV
ncbi:uncharacterized protein BDZ83DRAFT_623777 [Colletotrichum acutatum]|uniref:BZIP domain-containing protein n=1 Tax=Glomerella acutata TaxID=27357 RepID=A0AAD8UPN3_GLOAC|nr:uncharacterized protein BDZ83DRAFT_623777 [Colletotrichum acutatum]KAK1724165.1 hypothetical protein BDZ83DRAFT_623777 [Colletotrichum acutatum]